MTDMAPYTLVWVDRFGNVVFFFLEEGDSFLSSFSGLRAIELKHVNWVQT